MAPFSSRQLLVLTLPTIAALLSYLWYKRKRIGVRSDPGEHLANGIEPCNKQSIEKEIKKEEKTVELNTEPSTPVKNFSRSLSGIETTPIDIVLPPKLRASRSASKVVSDQELDLEIEKMRNGSLFSNVKIETSPPTQQTQDEKPQLNKTPSPPQTQTNVMASSKKQKKTKPKKKVVNKEIEMVSEQFTSVNITNNESTRDKRPKVERNGNNSNGNKTDMDLQRQSVERDSANHSPADVMLASPSLSIVSDNHSEGSNDSGKGGSDLATPPPSHIPPIGASSNVDVQSFYECIIPQTIVGKLIGRHGCFVNHIKDRTNAMILVKTHPTKDDMKICSIEGTQSEIDKALKMIRDKFPIKRYPDFTLEQVHFTPIVSTVPLIADHLYLKLIEGINNDTILSCLVTPNHLFLQQPTHPSFPSLNILSNFLNACYSEADCPLLPVPIPPNTVCVVYSVNAWYRAMVLSTDDQTETSYIKFLDHGGFGHVENSLLRQIRGDFILLPFQAAECVLADIRSVKEDGTWPEEAYNLVAELAKGHLIYTQIADYTEEGIPLVLCYIIAGPQYVVFLNQRLVDEGYAEWVQSDDTVQTVDQNQQQDSLEGAVGGIAVV